MFPDHVAFLAHIKNVTRAEVYLEIGVQAGTTLFADPMPRLAIGVDPAFDIKAPIRSSCHCALFREASDTFFDEGHFASVSRAPADVTFVDGLHWAEFALRDVRNAERVSHPGSVILIHDIHPLDAAMAGREDNPGAWMGDVFKVLPALRRFRPDLKVAAFGDVPHSGIAVVWGLDPGNRVLFDRYDEVARYMDGLDYDRDFATLVRSAFVSVDSPAFAAMIDEISRGAGRRPGRGLAAKLKRLARG